MRECFDPVEERQRHRDHHEAEVIVAGRVVKDDRAEVGKRRNQLETLGAAEDAELNPEQADYLARGKRADEEIEALHAEQGEAQDPGERGRGDGAHEHRERHRRAQLLGIQRARVAAHAHDDDVAKRPFAGQREQAVARNQQDVDQEEHRDLLLREGEQMRQRDQNGAGEPDPERPDQPARHARAFRTAPGAAQLGPEASAAGPRCRRSHRPRRW